MWWLNLSKITDLAKKAIESYVEKGEIISPPYNLDIEMQKKAGVFVCIKKAGALRGCIGTFAPTKENVADEIIKNAIDSASKDPRFPKITKNELSEISVSVDILTDPVRVKNIRELDAKKFGIIVKSGFRRGLLLPDLEGVNTPAQQIEICRRKGGIGLEEEIELFKFEVRRFE
ncbi:AMMECR1 domain-containing protein [candidate division WOR-1 bacterium RIFOXYA2_FULL_36_21]|uniref:AMMECR1 domain-containing protein n=1 Tax=candidate division WOR-1 bacterium RIFOXYB2_FULL_36_35 TaxID=1802578 RepID=A0A1F4S0S5_UNCSA|nr:MAG: AMMECR1 domain-containing protein [candidate division WOR-1 bacterium RIFOXYA2_FULL_36_21]OGC14028.1 MAG: AMMECR1 domain-containing protein [candidate division WOR-1 bacterium RIFOXYB2_FULL_36_35]